MSAHSEKGHSFVFLTLTLTLSEVEPGAALYSTELENPWIYSKFFLATHNL